MCYYVGFCFLRIYWCSICVVGDFIKFFNSIKGGWRGGLVV